MQGFSLELHPLGMGQQGEGQEFCPWLGSCCAWFRRPASGIKAVGWHCASDMDAISSACGEEAGTKHGRPQGKVPKGGSLVRCDLSVPCPASTFSWALQTLGYAQCDSVSLSITVCIEETDPAIVFLCQKALGFFICRSSISKKGAICSEHGLSSKCRFCTACTAWSTHGNPVLQWTRELF